MGLEHQHAGQAAHPVNVGEARWSGRNHRATAMATSQYTSWHGTREIVHRAGAGIKMTSPGASKFHDLTANSQRSKAIELLLCFRVYTDRIGASDGSEMPGGLSICSVFRRIEEGSRKCAIYVIWLYWGF
jgi:hypothetical protein